MEAVLGDFFQSAELTVKPGQAQAYGFQSVPTLDSWFYAYTNTEELL